MITKTYSPYRICPLGAHSDHQYGIVSGFALDHGITIQYTPTANEVCEIVSRQFDGIAQFYVGAVPPKQCDWADPLRGATLALEQKLPLAKGIKAEIDGKLPIGGLSSSAAVILAYLSALLCANNLQLTPTEIIEVALHAENDYVGVSCGKLDQSCEVYCKKNHLLYLDTKDDSFINIPLSPDCPPFEVAIFFSGLERSLAGSAFNTRVDELKSAAYALKAYAGIPYGKFADTRLREVPRGVFESYKDRLPETFRRRVTHFYTEFERVKKGVELWKRGDIEGFGQLIFESGYSSIYNFETGSAELIRLYEIMRGTKGIYGGRFSGAGFRGCCMALINPDYKDDIAAKVTREYLKTFPHLEGKFSIHYCQTADGVAHQLPIVYDETEELPLDGGLAL
jgi:galactokinase/galacturonokinase